MLTASAVHVRVLFFLYFVGFLLYMGLFAVYLHGSEKTETRTNVQYNFANSFDEFGEEDEHDEDRVLPPGVVNNDQDPACPYEQLHYDDTNEDFLDNCNFKHVSLDYLDKDIFTPSHKVSIPLLKNYRNPCWYERLPEDIDGIYQMYKSSFPDQAKESFDTMRPIIADRIQAGHMWRLRCLPLVYVIGVAKCGTTDFFQLLKQHPQFVKGATKEPLYWNKRGHASISDYLDLYDEAAEKIRKTVKTRRNGVAYHPIVTGDASVSYLFSFDGKNLVPENKRSTVGPIFHTPHMIKRATPKAKIILILRNPTERLYSEYMFFNKYNTSVEQFDSHVQEAVDRMSECLRKYHIRSCVYDDKYTDHKKTWIRLVAGMYAPFIKDWMTIFPHMQIIRMEDYHYNRTGIIQDVQRYIGLDVITPSKAKGSQITNQGSKYKRPMLDKTRTRLNKFYRPFNQELANLINNKRFLFDEYETTHN